MSLILAREKNETFGAGNGRRVTDGEIGEARKLNEAQILIRQQPVVAFILLARCFHGVEERVHVEGMARMIIDREITTPLFRIGRRDDRKAAHWMIAFINESA